MRKRAGRYRAAGPQAAWALRRVGQQVASLRFSPAGLARRPALAVPQPAAGVDQTGQTFQATPAMPQPSDAAAAGFYVTNPNNRLTNNAASGGYSGALRWGRGRGGSGVGRMHDASATAAGCGAGAIVHPPPFTCTLWQLGLPARPCLHLPHPAHAGFLYPVLPKAIGESRSASVVPAARPMLQFDGNSAHSSGYMW